VSPETVENGVAIMKNMADESQRLLDRLLSTVRGITENGAAIDDHQIITRRVAGLATQAAAARSLTDYVDAASARDDSTEEIHDIAFLANAEFAHSLRDTANRYLSDLNLSSSDLDPLDAAIRAAQEILGEHRYRAVGKELLQNGGANDRRIGTDAGDGADESEFGRSTPRRGTAVVFAGQVPAGVVPD